LSLDIQKVWFAAFGEDLKTKRKTGPDQYRVLCPFHDEREASCDVNLRKHVFACRSCGATGGAIDVIVLGMRLSNRTEAAKWLKRVGL
jgi:DNA primase